MLCNILEVGYKLTNCERIYNVSIYVGVEPHLHFNWEEYEFWFKALS